MSYPNVNTALTQSKDHLSRTTKSLKPSEVYAQWFVIDAEDLVLGRAAAIISSRLRGKHKPQFTPHVDTGDRIIVINAEKVAMTGKKLDQDKVYRHTGFSGGIKSESSRSILEGKYPERRLKKAVRGMMPRSPLFEQIFRKNLYVYAGPSHPHEAQQPKFLDVAALNDKNVKGRSVAQAPGIIKEIKDAIDAAFVPLKKSLLASEQAIIATEKAIAEIQKDSGESKESLRSTREEVTAMKEELTAIKDNTNKLVVAMESNTAAIQALAAQFNPK